MKRDEDKDSLSKQNGKLTKIPVAIRGEEAGRCLRSNLTVGSFLIACLQKA